MRADATYPEDRSGLLTRSAPLLLLAVAVLAIYLITYNGAITSADEASLIAATESLVKHGDLRTDQLTWAVWAHGWQAQGAIGPDGHVYSKKGFGLPYLLAPAVSAAMALPGFSKTHVAFLAGILSAVGVVLLMFLLARRWGAHERAALALALITAFATPLWHYSRTLFQETPSALALLLLVYGISGRLQRRDGLIAGLALAVGIAIRTTNALALAPVLFYLLYRTRGLNRGRMVALFLTVIGPAVLALLATGFFNWQRFGSPLNTGYTPQETFTTPLWQGLYGMLLGPAKGLLFFAPVFLLVLFAAPASWRRRPAETALLLAMAGSMLILFSLWYDWGGGLAWGPRFALPAIPLLMPLLLPILEGEGRRVTRLPAYMLIALSTLIQFAAATTSYLETSGPWPVLTAFRELAKGGWRGMDIAWLRARPDVQWLPLTLFGGVAVVALAGAMILVRSPRTAREGNVSPVLVRFLPVALLILVTTGCALGLLGIHADLRLPGGDDYRSLSTRLAQAARSSDVVLVDNHTRTDFFLSEDRSRAPRYDLLRSDVLVPPAAELLARLAQEPGVLWLVSDRPASAVVPKPEEGWLDEHAFRWREETFSPYARLIGYRVPNAADMPAGQQGLRFDNGWEARWSVETDGYPARQGAGPVFEVILQSGASAAANVAASVQLMAPDGSLAWQSDRLLDSSGPPVKLRGAAVLPARVPGRHRLLLILYDTQTGVPSRLVEPANAVGQDSAEIGQVIVGVK